MDGGNSAPPRVTAQGLRALAREALCAAGARGFVRFAPEGDGALLLTDAVRFCAESKKPALLAALGARGFSCHERAGLLMLTPQDALLLCLAEGAAPLGAWDWESPLAPAFSLADRWMRAPDAPLSPGGRQLLVETARLLGQPEERVLFGLSRLRARAAIMQRGGDLSGLRVCGGALAIWCLERVRLCGD